jgi:hypothetical protein
MRRTHFLSPETHESHAPGRLAFTPCFRATAATDAPGAIASSRIVRFSSFVLNRRLATDACAPPST